MAQASPPTDLLACPRCDRAPLAPGAQGYRCDGCKIDFPTLAGIPVLFAEPNAALGEWRQRLHLALETLQRNAKHVATALKAKHLNDLTRDRLNLLQQAYAAHRQELGSLLEPLEVARLSGKLETYLALRTRLPADQGLTTYYPNIHRDWCWGDAENQACLELIQGTLGEDRQLGRTLVLGAGAARLAYDLHMQSQAEITLALDFNPLLLLIAQRVCAGETVQLHEFPIAPRRLADQAIQRTLAAPVPVRGGFHLILGDVLRPPFPTRAFDTVVTPWLVDILPVDFKRVTERVNALTADGGRWLNFGSLAFRQPEPELCYSYEEMLELVAHAGFQPPAVTETTLPYMCSPASRHARREQVLAFAACKTKHVGKLPRYQALPDWIVTGKQPVPLTESFQTQAMSTRIYGFVMSMIDGKRTIKDMAALMEQQQLMPRQEAEPAIRAFLTKMYDESRQPPAL